MLYCTYDMPNMFRALLCPSSGALDYMCVIAAYGVQCLVAGCRGSGAGQQGVRLGRGMLHFVQHPSLPLPLPLPLLYLYLYFTFTFTFTFTFYFHFVSYLLQKKENFNFLKSLQFKQNRHMCVLT